MTAVTKVIAVFFKRLSIINRIQVKISIQIKHWNAIKLTSVKHSNTILVERACSKVSISTPFVGMRLICILALLVRHNKDQIRIWVRSLEIRNHRVERSIKCTYAGICTASYRTVAKPKIIGSAKNNHQVRGLIHIVHPVNKGAWIRNITVNICDSGTGHSIIIDIRACKF